MLPHKKTEIKRERERERGGVEARPQGAIWCAISPLRLYLFAIYCIAICTCCVMVM